ncbi:MAG: potassium channel protein [Planctomycetes bacterium]|nr:potassium channel protein [Planctomycetota bacterium]
MKKLLLIIALLLGFLILGAVSFRLTEGWDWLQCFYEAVIIMTTVGLSATSQGNLNPSTKMFIICYLMVGVGIFTYCVTQLGQLLVNLQVRGYWERRAMDHSIKKLKDHFVVCGFGRMGRTICRYLHSRHKPFVVIDSDERIAAACRELGWLHLIGDATDDEILLTAGIMEAKALTTVLATDADNIYVVLSARLLNDKMQIVARASDEKAIDKLERAGATRVVSPFSSGAMKIARFMLNPSVEDFFEVTDDHGSQLELADVQISATSPCVGKRLMDTDLRERGVMVVGIRRANGERLMPPPGTAVIEAGDCLFAFGSSQAVNEMINLNVGSE